MVATLKYSRDELMRGHPFARAHEAAGYRLHGGFADDGVYVSPRTLVRWPAVKGWGEALQARGWPLIDASAALLDPSAFPRFQHQNLLPADALAQRFSD